MRLFQVDVKEKSGDALKVSYHYFDYLESARESLQAQLEAGEIIYYKITE
jgi:exosome complex RNA-binding protein Rrp4